VPGTRAASDAFALPLIVAVTGHRNLVPAETAGIRDRIRALFIELGELCDARRLVLASPLAEGADQLAADVALELGIDLVVPLPGPTERYLEDFVTVEGRKHFAELADAASEVFVIESDSGAVSGETAYARLGAYLSAHCDILLAVWDGKPSEGLGGTAQVVTFHHDRYMRGHAKGQAVHEMLVDDESDLIYHIACSRNVEDGSPVPGLQPLDAVWFTKDADNPRSATLPEQHQRVLQRGCTFSEDVRAHAHHMQSGRDSLLDKAPASVRESGVGRIDYLYGLADWLAIHYQRKTLLVLRIVHVLAFLMGLMFILYTDLQSTSHFMLFFLLFFAAAVGLQKFARQRRWQQKYLEYRTLAEGLRVQLYWAAAGVTNEPDWQNAQDCFLQSEDPELGWIRNAMRGAGLRSDAVSNRGTDAFHFVLAEWVGSQSTGQLGYYARTAAARAGRHRLTEGLGRVSLAASIVIVIVFLMLGDVLSGSVDAGLQLGMGGLLLLFAVREGYAYATATKELIKQYELMLRIFGNAYRRLQEARDLAEQRQVLYALGRSALMEHADWLIMHRERALEEGEIWRLGN